MTIMDIIDSLPAGSRHQGCLQGRGSVSLFYTILKGQASRPLLTVSAAVHGCEYVGVKTVMELSHEWQFAGQGSILLLHAVNLTGFLARETTLVPEDKVNLNRIFQDVQAPQTFSYQIKQTIQEEIFPYTDYLVDLHGGNREELLTPHGYYSLLADPAVAEVSYQMLQASGTPLIYASKASGGMYQSASIDYQIPSILLEQGENGTCLPQDVLVMKEAVRQVAAYVFDKVQPYYRTTSLYFDDSYYITCQGTGCWTCFVQPNQTVQEGQVIGEICDIYGNIMETIRAERDGLVLYQKATLVVFEEELLVAVACHSQSSGCSSFSDGRRNNQLPNEGVMND